MLCSYMVAMVIKLFIASSGQSPELMLNAILQVDIANTDMMSTITALVA